MGVVVVTHERFADHVAGAGHPERPGRLGAVTAGLASAREAGAVSVLLAQPVDEGSLVAVHDPEAVAGLDELARTGGGWVDADTYVGPRSMEAARLAAGAGLVAAAALDGGAGDLAWCVVRPPGHHARPAQAMGFCLLNNVAVTARFLADRGERVLVLDWDAHHGNGTQDAFWDDPRVLVASVHQWGIYPGTGAIVDTGGPSAPGATINVPVPAGATGDVFLSAVDELIGPASANHGTTWVLVSAGFDSHRADPLANLALSAGDYGMLTRRVLDLAPSGRRVLFLEGGYDMEALTASVASVTDAAVGGSAATEAPTSGGPGLEVVSAAAQAHREAIGN